MNTKKKALFIDRDGTIIVEPPSDQQVDSLEKLEFIPKAISCLRKIAQFGDYELVMVTNQDGLGTESFPEDRFWPAHNKMLRTLENEDVFFDEILIDRSFPEDNASTRKPRTGLLTEYLSGSYDLSKSFVIGDRLTDVELAKNLGAKSIFFSNEPSDSADFTTRDWEEIFRLAVLEERTASIHRKTHETDISIRLNLDGAGLHDIRTGLNFFNHMLDQLSRHSGCGMDIKTNGDLHVDEHHTIEDTAIALGEAFRQALGDKRGINRYGFLLPMDDSLAQVALDFGGRAWLVWDVSFKREKIGDMPTEMFYHFFKSFADAAQCNLNIKAEGNNEHHKIEAIFKALAKAIKMAIQRVPEEMKTLPSTKGVL